MPQTELVAQTSGAFPAAEYMCATGPSHLDRFVRVMNLLTSLYHDIHRMLSLHGNEIRSVNVPDLGTLVSVTLVLIVDTGTCISFRCAVLP
jgi:hypothetical protein